MSLPKFKVFNPETYEDITEDVTIDGKGWVYLDGCITEQPMSFHRVSPYVDSNGNEIFEGLIVRLDGQYSTTTELTVTVNQEGLWMMKSNSGGFSLSYMAKRCYPIGIKFDPI